MTFGRGEDTEQRFFQALINKENDINDIIYMNMSYRMSAYTSCNMHMLEHVTGYGNSSFAIRLYHPL